MATLFGRWRLFGRGSARALAALAALAFAGACAPPPIPPQTIAHVPGPFELPKGTRDAGAEGPIPVSASDPARGSASALVTIVEFADFQCAFCQRAAETVMTLQREYGPEQLRVVWKHYPLPFHREARPAAEAGAAIFERAGAAGFWRYHDAIFTAKRPLGRALFDEAVAASGVAPEDVVAAARAGGAARKVEADEQLGRQIGVSGTPAFFVNGVLVHGAQPIERFRAVVDAQLAAAKRALAGGTPAAGLYSLLSAQGFVPPKAAAGADDEDDEPADTTVYRVPVTGSPSRGKPTALVTIVEFADFECPYCVRAEETLKQVEARYGDKVRLVWKHMPLPFHRHATPAAELAAEAFAQKGDAGFWKAHDLLLAQRGHLEGSDLEQAAKAAGLDAAKAMQALARHDHAAAVARDVDLAEDVEATGTPTFFVNGRKLVGALPFDAFRAVVDAEIAQADAAVAAGAQPGSIYETLQQNAKLAPMESAVVPPPTPASPSRGPSGAKVVVQVWSDFECPFCKRVEPTLAELDAAFPGKLRFVWHNHPLPFHPHALPAAEAAMEAFAQKGAPAFWRMHDLILENQEAGMDRVALERYATSLGLDLPRFRAALDGGVHRAAIEADAKVGQAAGLDATPGVMISGYRVSGAQPLSRFKRVVRRALAEAK
jgi:protein-disulfide isomerase